MKVKFLQMAGILYRLTFPNGKAYVGITSKSLSSRCKGHLSFSNGAKCALSNAVRKYGDVFKREVLVIGSMAYLKELEIKAIAALGTLSPYGYNLSLGGDISPMHNPTVAAKISRSMKKNNPMSNTVHKATMLAAISTKEYKEFQRRKALAQWAEKDSKIRANASSKEFRKKLSKAQFARQARLRDDSIKNS